MQSLRDSGCSCIVVNKDLVKDDEHSDLVRNCVMIDGSIIQIHTGRILIYTPIITSNILMQAALHAIYTQLSYIKFL